MKAIFAAVLFLAPMISAAHDYHKPPPTPPPVQPPPQIITETKTVQESDSLLNSAFKGVALFALGDAIWCAGSKVFTGTARSLIWCKAPESTSDFKYDIRHRSSVPAPGQ